MSLHKELYKAFIDDMNYDDFGHYLADKLERQNGLIAELRARIDYLEAQISAARKALENAQFTEALNILDEAESEGK